MSKPRWAAVRHSVFTKLAAIMVAMALGLLLLVGAFFLIIVGPSVHTSMDRVLRDYAHDIAAQSPDLAAARKLSIRTNVAIRYEGPAAQWTTSPDLPSIEATLNRNVPGRYDISVRRTYVIAAAPDGGRYLFAWGLDRDVREAHTKLIILLLGTIAAVIVITYIVLQRLLRPLRALNDGVTRLGGGELDVALPHRTRDEFGRLTEAFNRMVGQVRSMIGARDQLLLDVSHELRSPLTRMKVALEMLPEGPQRSGMAADVAEMEQMISELLELERLRSGRGLHKKRQNLLPILQELAAQYRNTPPGVQVRAAATELAVDIDEEKIRAAVRNLIENAMKYSSAQARPIEIVAGQEADATTVRVLDDGPGIPEADAERVFEPFFRLDRSRSKDTGGFGLGLSLCKRVMQAHGGDVRLDLTHPKGACFVLTLPTPADR